MGQHAIDRVSHSRLRSGRRWRDVVVTHKPRIVIESLFCTKLNTVNTRKRSTYSAEAADTSRRRRRRTNITSLWISHSVVACGNREPRRFVLSKAHGFQCYFCGTFPRIHSLSNTSSAAMCAARRLIKFMRTMKGTRSCVYSPINMKHNSWRNSAHYYHRLHLCRRMLNLCEDSSWRINVCVNVNVGIGSTVFFFALCWRKNE